MRCQNGIDIITENEIDGKLTFYEVKRKKENIIIGNLKKNPEAIFAKNKISSNYDIDYKGQTLVIKKEFCFLYLTSSNLSISDNHIFNSIWYKYEISLRLK